MATRSLYRFDATSLPIPCQGLLMEEVGDDVVIYEPTTKIAHAVNSAAASVLVLCDGKTSVAEIVHELTESGADPDHKLEDSVVSILEQFAEKGLVSIKPSPAQ